MRTRPRSFVLGAFRTFSFLLSSVRLKLWSSLFQDKVKVFPIFRGCGLINEALYKPRFTVDYFCSACLSVFNNDNVIIIIFFFQISAGDSTQRSRDGGAVLWESTDQPGSSPGCDGHQRYTIWRQGIHQAKAAGPTTISTPECFACDHCEWDIFFFFVVDLLMIFLYSTFWVMGMAVACTESCLEFFFRLM
jgi:hypothetical protein